MEEFYRAQIQFAIGEYLNSEDGDPTPLEEKLVTIFNRATKTLELIKELILHGSSLTMGWDEESRAWEVAFITGGKRYVNVSTDLFRALEQVQRKAKENAPETPV